jgi:diguanylate cyclase
VFAEHLPRLLPITRDMFALHVRWNRMALAMVSLLALYGAWQVFGWPASHRTLIGDLFFFPVGFAAMWAAACAGRRCASNRRLRGGWYLLAVASALYLAGDAAQTVYELAGNKPYPSVADALYLLFYPVMLLGVLRFATPQRGDRQRLRLALDLATVAIGGAVLVIYVVLGPTVVAGGQDPVQTAFSIAYPVGDMVLLVALASVLLRQPPAASRSSLRLLAAGLFFYVIADLVYGYITLHSTYQGGDPVDTLWMIAICAARAGRSGAVGSGRTRGRRFLRGPPGQLGAVPCRSGRIRRADRQRER